MPAKDISLDDFYRQRLITDVRLSPGGDRVAFVADEFDATEDERRPSLFVVPADGSGPPHRLTRVSAAGAPRWSPDGTKLGFVASRDEDVELSVGPPDDAEDDGGADADRGTPESRPQVWYFDLDRGGDARQLTTFDEGVEGFDWSPTGERIVVKARDPTEAEAEYLAARREENGPVVTERLQHKADGHDWLDDVTSYLFVVDVETGARTRLDDTYGGGGFETFFGAPPCWGPDDRIAFVSNRTERPDDSPVLDIYAVDPDGSNLRKLTDSNVLPFGMRWSPDGERLAFTGWNPPEFYEPNMAYVTAADEPVRSVSGSLDRTLQFPPVWLDETTLLGLIGDGGHGRLARFHLDGDGPERVFEAQGKYRTALQLDARSDAIALCLTRPDEPPELHAMDRADLDAGTDEPDPTTRLTDLNGELAAETPMPGCRRVTFRNGDGDEIEGIAYLPPDFDPSDPEPRPVIASAHGGPISFDSPVFDFDYVYWTNRGYVVLRTNYRGSSSYGREFAESIRGDWGPREVDDVVSGVDALVERGWADPERAFVTGFSYGGITTAHVVTRTDQFAAAAAEHGIYDLSSVFGTNDFHMYHEGEFGLPWEEPEAYRAASSITDVGDVETPLLVTAGGRDWRTPASQAEQLYVSVRKRGVPAKLVVYPDEHHNIGDPDRATHRLQQITEWFEEHAPDSTDEDG